MNFCWPCSECMLNKGKSCRLFPSYISSLIVQSFYAFIVVVDSHVLGGDTYVVVGWFVGISCHLPGKVTGSVLKLPPACLSLCLLFYS
jgi:hypothetical protein